MDVTARKKKGLTFRLFEGKIGRAILIASFVILTIGLPLAYLFTKNQTPVSSWFNNSWEYRQAINVTNAGGVKTNYDVLVTVDTASLIASSKIQNDCDDIRIVDSDDTTVLSYWIEGGCNTSSTRIWVRVPSLSVGSTTLNLYYGNGSATSGSLTWAGSTHILFNGSCPVGWTRVTASDGRYLMGDATYGTTGGSSTHNHSNVSCTSGVASASLLASSGGATASALSSGTHTSLSGSVSSTSNTPPYLDQVLCKNTSTSLPASGISLFDTTVPAGWTRVNALDGVFAKLEASVGSSGGTSSHTHAITGAGATGSSSPTNAVAASATGGTITTSGGYTIHTFTSSGTFYSPSSLSVEYLVVAGGGGGAQAGGGGTGGQVRTGSLSISSGNHTVTIGGGGASGGGTGGSSVFSSITSSGGTYPSGYGDVLNAPAGGTYSSITGVSVLYGISGAAATAYGGGWNCGADNGGPYSGYGVTGVANTGGGGSAGDYRSGGVSCPGWAGGSGIVVVRYVTPSASSFAGTHTHNAQNTTSGSISHLPPYLDMVFASKDSGGFVTDSAIMMFDVLPPLGWRRFTALDNNFARGAATYGGAGGSSTHANSVNLVTGTPSSTFSLSSLGATSFATSTHTHSCSTSLPSTSSLPPYFTMIYGQMVKNSSDSITYGFGAEESNVPVPPTITAAQGLTTTSIRWNFIDNAANETGFKVFDMSGTLKATCVGANLSHCDETGLSVNTQYERQIKAYNANGDSLTYSSSTTRYTLAPVPTTTVTDVTENSATVEVGSMVNYNVDQSGWYYDCTQTNCDNGSFNTWVTSTSLVDTGLNSNTQYTFRVKARNGDGVETAYSVSDSKYTLAPIPEIGFSAVDSGSITLGTPNLNNFGVDQSAVLYECGSINSGECDTGEIWENTGAQTLTQLQSNKEYMFRAKARNGDGIETGFSDYFYVNTAAASPLELTISDILSDSLKITLNGDSNGNPSVTEYLVREAGSNTYLNPLTNSLEVTPYWGTYADFEETTGVIVNNLEDGVLYSFDVKARNTYEVETDYSNEVDIYTLLSTPTLESGQALSSSSIRWTITESTDNETGVKIYDGANNVVATCNGVDLAYCDESSLSSNTSYSRRVVIFNEDVESAKSNQISAYTRTNTPGAPTLSFGLNQVQVTINANSNPAPTLYSIMEQSGLFVQSDGTLGVTEVKKNIADWGTILVTGLSPNTSYTFSVKAENGDASHQTTSSTSTGYTFATGVSAPTVTGSTTTNVDVEINPGVNPNTTQYAIYHVGTGSYVDFVNLGATVGLVQDPAWATYSQWGGASGKNVTGFTPNSLQEFKVMSRNGDGVESALSASGAGYTFANRLSAPTLSAISSTVMKVVIDQSSNPSNTLFAVRINNSLYINHQTGLSQSSPDFVTYLEWGGIDGIGVTGLSPDGNYTFSVFARNGDGFTALPNASASLHTLANVPGIPELVRITSTSANLNVDNNGNPSTVEYVIQEVVSGDYIALNGNFTQSEVWGTNAQWGSSNGVTLNQLILDNQYEFRVKARNSNNIETAYSSTTNSYSSLGAPVIGTPTVLDSTTIRWNFSETLSNETGFRILNSNGDQVAQCASANITYCDEYGLTPNTSYTRFVVAYDGNGNGDISENSAQASTFALVPSAPTVTVGNTSTTLNLVIEPDAIYTDNVPRFVVREAISGYFVNDTGALIQNEIVGSYSDFGQEDGIVINGLFANARYVFEVKAVNVDDISSAYSSQTAKYTKVSPLTTPTVEGVSESSLRVKIGNSGNPPFTQYQIKDLSSGKFVPKNGGNLTNASVWGTYSEFGSSSGILVTGLTANTSYVFEISARNGDNEVGSIIESSPVYTFSARPDSLITTAISPRELNITLPSKYSGSTERFAIFNNELSKFVNAQGQFVDDPAWLTFNQFGGTNGVNIAGLIPGKGYTFVSKTRNQLNIETQYSNGSTAYTQPLSPIKPEATVISTTGARLYLIDPGNDSSVVYAIQEVVSGKFVSKVNGNLVDGASWGTLNEFGGSGGFVVKGLPSASDTQFRVRSRNLGQVASSYSEQVLVQTNALIYNVPADVKVTLAQDRNVDVSQLEGSQRGTKELELTKSDVLLAKLSLKFDSDKDWGNVIADIDTQNSKSVVKFRPESGLEGTFSLYVPVNNTQKLIVCPDSDNLSEVTVDCTNKVVFEGQVPITKEVENSEVTVNKEEIDGTIFWVAQGLKGTGIIGESVTDEGKEPTVVPEPEPETEQNPPLVIDINAEQIVQNINNETVKNVAKAVLIQAPQRTVLAMKQVSNVVETTALGNLDQPQLEVVSTVATATTVTVGLAVLAGGFVNIPYLVVQLVIGLLSFFGFVKKSRPYGLVYDSITKKPIDRAVVRVYNMSEKLVWTDVTSAFGTFGANLPIGRYKILVVKPGYKFPSTVVSSPIDYPLEPVYHGEVIKFNRRNEFNIVIPMDQIEKKGIAKTIAKLFSSASILVKLGHILLFLAGFLLAVHTIYLYPSSYNLIALIFYVPALFLVLRNLFIKERSKGMVIDRNGNPIEGVTVTLKEMRFDKFVAKRVTDKNGEYQMIVPNGTYQLGIMDEGYRAVRYEGGSSIVSRKRKGKELVIDRAIIVRKK